jgi:iron complex transport system ATP-binding protein
MVLHDLNQAARYAHHLVAISFGQVVAEGEPGGLLTPELIRRVFGVDAHVIPDPETGHPICVPRYLVGTV